MAAELDFILTWTFMSETSIPKDVNNMLVDGERAVAAYKTIRDVAIFTNKRLIVRDAQGITGKRLKSIHCPIRASTCIHRKMPASLISTPSSSSGPAPAISRSI